MLLSYNDYNNSELGGYTVYIVKDDSLEPKYKQGSILLIKSTNDKNVQIGDEMFLYKVINSQEYEVVDRTLAEKEQQGRHIIYYVEDEESYANDYFIGKASDTIVIEGWGFVLGLLESRWGYLFCVVVVSLLLFLQEVFELVMEIKYLGEQKKKNAVEVEEEDDESDSNEKEVKKAPAKKSTTTKKTTSPNKATNTKKTTSPNKATTTKKITSTNKASTSKKSTKKSAKEEE